MGKQTIPCMNLKGDLQANWKVWRQLFEIYLVASESDKKPETTQCAILLHLIGSECIHIYNTFTFGDKEKDNLKILIKKFESYFNPKGNETYERYKFFTRSMKTDESIDNYVTDLRNLANTCNFGNLTDSLIRDRIVCGIGDTNLREKLLQVTDLSLEVAINMCKAAEVAKAQSSSIGTGKSKTENAENDVHVLNRKKFNKNMSNSKNKYYNVRSSGNYNEGNKPSSSYEKTKNTRKSCNRCGSTHSVNKCHAYGKTCFKCGKPNHFAPLCRSKSVFSKYGIPRARECLFWPGINNDIANLVSKCDSCTTYRRSNIRESLVPHPIPKNVWQKVGVDIFEWKHKQYLLFVDYYSKFVEVCLLYNTTSSDVINHCKSVFSKYGIPDVLMSDNGPQFSSREFKEFSIIWEFTHVTSSPRYPQSNGMAEKTCTNN